jgi:hypothetical protein
MWKLMKETKVVNPNTRFFEPHIICTALPTLTFGAQIKELIIHRVVAHIKINDTNQAKSRIRFVVPYILVHQSHSSHQNLARNWSMVPAGCLSWLLLMSQVGDK